MVRSRRRLERTGIEANLTSLIDVTFLLIVFFVLVSRVNEIENVDIDLPNPIDAASTAIKSENQVIITVLPGEGGSIRGYRVGVQDFEHDETGLSAVQAHLAGLYQLNPHLDVNIRADRFTHYEFIEPLMNAVSRAARSALKPGASPGVARVNLAVVKESR